MFTVRLDRDAKKRLDDLSKATGLSKSEVVREAIRAYEPATTVESEMTVAERLADVIGTAHIGGSRARDSERILREGFARKRRST